MWKKLILFSFLIRILFGDISDNSVFNDPNKVEPFPQSQLHDGISNEIPHDKTHPDIPNFVSHPDNAIPEDVIELTDATVSEEIKKYDVMLLNFHAEWCHFSKMLNPVFEQAWDDVKKAIPNEAKVLFGKVDCDKNIETCTKYRVSKYPTIKLFRLGSERKEYKGERSAHSITAFVLNQLKDHLKNLTSTNEINQVSKNKTTIIAYFKDPHTAYYKTLQIAGFYLKDDCNFFVGIGPNFQSELDGHDAKLFFRPAYSTEAEPYDGTMDDFEVLSRWIFLKCTPLVREITRENAEELTEEELPFLILFYDPNNLEPIKLYREAVQRDLSNIRNTINPVYANGDAFSHPLQHLNKYAKDLPLIVIDSFRHMYIFPEFKDIHKNGSLLNFVNDLHSGKLHRDFHNIPEPVKHEEHKHQEKPHSHKTPVPESTFNMLKPSYTRYTLLKTKDEL